MRNLHEEGKIAKIRKGNLNVFGEKNKFVENIRKLASKMVEGRRRKAGGDNFVQLLEEIVVFGRDSRKNRSRDIALNSIKFLVSANQTAFE